MDFVAVLLLAIGLAMDAFAVSVCKGLAMKNPSAKQIATVGIWFGVFQAAMPVAGYFIGSALYDFTKSVAPWIAFALLALIGLNMIREALSEEEKIDGSLDMKVMFVLAVATSIDALAAGVSIAMSGDNIAVSAVTIGIVTLVLSAVGVKIGSVFGTKYSKPAEMIGGIILIALGAITVLKVYF